MHSKKNNTNKTIAFTQGLRPFSSLIPRGLKKILKKGGYNFSNVVDNWTKIVGKDVSELCYPSTIKVGNNLSNGTLILNVMHGKELEIEYNKKVIIDKINDFFGYSYIEQIKLKVVQEKREIKKDLQNIITVKKKFEKKIDIIKNKDLQKSLNNLINAYNKKND